MQIKNFRKSISVLSISAALLLTPMVTTAGVSYNASQGVKVAAVATEAKTLDLINVYYSYPFDGYKDITQYVKDVKSNRIIKIYDNGNAKNIKPQVQIYNTSKKVWETKATAKYTKIVGGIAQYSYNSGFLSTPKSYQLRIYIPKTSKTYSFTSKISNVKVIKESHYKLSLSSLEKPISYGGYAQYTFSLDKAIKKIQVQTYNSKTKKWSTQSTLKGNNSRFNWRISHPKIAKTVKYRLYVPATTTHNSLTSSVVTVKFAKGKTALAKNTKIDVNKLSNRTTDKLRVTIGNSPKQKVSIQEYNYKTKKWVNKSSVTSSNTTKTQTVLLPYPKLSTGNHKLRISIAGNANFYGKSSGSKTVKYINPNSYKGTSKTVYNYVKKYCPGVTIDIKNLPKGTAGTASFPKNHINISKKISGKQLKDTSLHECGHILQLNAFNEDTTALTKRANAVYKSKKYSGIELQADCIVQVMTGKELLKYHTYKGYKKCTSRELSAAKKIVQGKRF